MAQRAENRVFGKRQANHVLILASGEQIRHMTIRPWMIAIGLSAACMALVGYLGATSYLVVRDDLIGATMARQARMQHDYEDRIAALRAQLDRITSRQLLDQQVVEKKVEKLLEQQDAIFSRHGKLGSLLDRAQQSGIEPSASDAPAFAPGSDGKRADAGGASAISRLLAKSDTADAQPANASSNLATATLREGAADRADRMFSKVTLSLKTLENQQLNKVASLTTDASNTADAITSILAHNGVDIDETAEEDKKGGVGGPYVAPRLAGDRFDQSLDDLDAALTRLENVRDTARALPFANPAPGEPITSRFGNRIDPFLGRLALHSGIDFAAQTGDGVKTTGTGKVTIAGVINGYGNMVEIDHGYGIATRYGHLSKILVSVGDEVRAGDIIGRAGSTGRSTGPHIHYEVRRNGQPIDPMHFLNAGMKLTTYLE
ncbi:M23 family metallopeptidase [Neorhizobium sp. NCHU2750]|uniref:M23 family metallopeptidase n=1 Tax=Neorhizobium sp. NCHU2750 TaxID=1825976 RepID=UPI000E771E4B|nr:metalloendopeptidase-like membrane protein [Neorhizobium sp. NCHU2750]